MKTDERTPIPLFAHTPPEGSDNWHRLDDHLRAVAELAAQFGAPFGAGDEARLAGLLHDAGKAGDLFQEYLRACQAGERGEVVSGAPRAPHTEGSASQRQECSCISGRPVLYPGEGLGSGDVKPALGCQRLVGPPMRHRRVLTPWCRGKREELAVSTPILKLERQLRPPAPEMHEGQHKSAERVIEPS